MVNKIVRNIGFGFVVLGLIWSVLDGFFCQRLCKICSGNQNNPCYFLFLFVGIILIVSGTSLFIRNRNKGKKK